MLSWVFCLGKIVVGALHEIKKLQFDSREGDDFPIGDRLTDELELIEDVLLAPPPPPHSSCSCVASAAVNALRLFGPTRRGSPGPACPSDLDLSDS